MLVFMGRWQSTECGDSAERGRSPPPAGMRGAQRNFLTGKWGVFAGNWDGIRVDMDAGGMRQRPWGHFSAALTSPEGHGPGRAGILKDAGRGEILACFSKNVLFSGKRKGFL